MKKQYLLTPGPAPVPKEIMDEMARPIIHHRTPQYMEIAKSANERLKKIFKTKNNVLTLTSSGTGAMEASIVNTLSKGDSAIVVVGGKFGERFAEICTAYGVNVVAINVEWGDSPKAAVIEKALNENPAVKAVFMQLCETSTATTYDVKSIGEVVKKTSAILVVDAISGLGADDLKTDEWNVDIAIGGSQKAFMLPPGIAFCVLSEKAKQMMKTSTLPKFYCNLAKYEKLVEKGDSPWTPAITLVIGLGKALELIEKDGIDNFIKRHTEDAEFTRKYLKDIGLEIFSKSPSDAVTAVNMPADIDTSKLIKVLKENGVTFAGGQAQLKGKIVRIAHMGAITRDDLKHALGLLKETLKTESVKA